MILKFFKKKSNVFFSSLLLLSIILECLFRVFPRFSEFYCNNLLPIIRWIYYPLSIFPFAISETLVLMAAILVLMLSVIFITKAILRNSESFAKLRFKVFVATVLRCAVIIFFLFVFTFSASYHRLPISQHMGLDTNITEEELESAARRAASELLALSEEIPYSAEQMSESGMSFALLSKEVKKSADKAAEKYPFLQKGGVRAKPLAMSVPMTWTHIAGMYTFFTGEPCININYADYTLPYTVAHEYSHQRGIGPENEADFTAFLILLESDVPYLRYSAWAEAFLSLSNELYEVDKDAYREIVSTLPNLVLNDYYVASNYYSKYEDSAVGEVAEAVNDTYLKANGVESGVRSYSQSVILLVSYLNS